ncbi:DUF4397 domain-containing protein [Tumebacillus sp. DT12]|uniref:DUF4397 domain-containing protein n=1 Tax=Tumebacillus lacus TaxID=2995335 RepID=A0ABT3X2B0_9BACL|nr:DUF4397 domain-containing protein [Tumebacillus lacus]MCX7570083.1 DUF4397 domain-containing protein [Tumebacillus lacus]
MKDERQVAYELLMREMEKLAELIHESQQNQHEFMQEAYQIIREQGQDVELMRHQQSLGQYILEQLQQALQADGKLPSTMEIALPPELQDQFQQMTGTMQPGLMPSGTMQPGMMPSGTMQPGTMQPGMMPSGTMQPGTMQPGTMQPGTMQPGMMPKTADEAVDLSGGMSQSMQPGTGLPQPTELVPPARAEETAVAGITDDGQTETDIRPQKAAQAQVRFLHAAPGVPNVDVVVDGRKVATDVGYEGISPYLALGPGAHRVQLFRTGQTTGAVIDQEVKLLPNRHYTVAVSGIPEDVKPVVVEDSRRGGKPGFARLKIVHLATNAPSVDVTLPSGKILIGDLRFRKISPYLQVTPGVRDLELRQAGKKETLIKIPQITFDKNITYTLYVLPQVSPQRAVETLLLPEA